MVGYWESFMFVVIGFLGNKKDTNYKSTTLNMLEKFRILGCNMSIKVYFLHLHLDYFPENLKAINEKKSKRFHQHIKEMERKCIMLIY